MFKNWYLPFLLLLSVSTFAQSYKKLHQKALVVDTHNDVLIAVMQGHNLDHELSGKTHSDLARFRQGGVDVQVFSIWSDEQYGKGTGFRYANRQIDSLYAIAARNKDQMMLVTAPAELRQAVKQKKLGAMMGMEGGHMLEDNIDYIDSLHHRGVRYITLTWNNSTSWATSAKDETEGTTPNGTKGLTELGRQMVQRMNQLGVMVDLSHVGEQTFWDVLQTTTQPVLISHSCVYHLCPHPRNLKDDQIKAVGKNGGVIHLNFYSGFLDSTYQQRKESLLKTHAKEMDSLKAVQGAAFDNDQWLSENYAQEVASLRPPLSLLLDHLDYVVKLIGVDHVGLGSDFDGIESAPRQLDDVTHFPNITQALLQRGYSKKDIRKILGENFVRVFRANTK